MQTPTGTPLVELGDDDDFDDLESMAPGRPNAAAPLPVDHPIEAPEDPPPRPTPREGVPTMTCDGCGHDVQLEEFSRYLAVAGDLDETTAPRQLCDYCSVYGPPLEDPLHTLTPRQIKGLEMLASGGTLRGAARVMKISATELKQMMRGQDRTLFRAAYQRLLIQEGLDPRSLARTFKEAIESEKMQWNPERQAFDAFPDTGNRLKAAIHLQKTFQLDAPAEAADAGAVKGNTFNFVTNLDGKSEAKQDTGYTIIDAKAERQDG